MSLAARRPRRLTLTRVVVFLNLFVVALLAVLMATSLARGLSARAVNQQVANLEVNLARLQQNRQAGLDALQVQLSDARNQLAQAEAGTPKLGAPYLLFERGFALGSSAGVDVTRIERGGDDIEHTALGDLAIQTYVIDLSGELPACLVYVASLEREGRPFLATDNFSFMADPLSCSFSVIVLGTDTSGRPSSP